MIQSQPLEVEEYMAMALRNSETGSSEVVGRRPRVSQFAKLEPIVG
jgi:hypothetical protein